MIFRAPASPKSASDDDDVMFVAAPVWLLDKQALTNCMRNHMGSIARPCLQPDMVNVPLHSAWSDGKLLRDFFRRQAQRDKLEDLYLTLGQVVSQMKRRGHTHISCRIALICLAKVELPTEYTGSKLCAIQLKSDLHASTTPMSPSYLTYVMKTERQSAFLA